MSAEEFEKEFRERIQATRDEEKANHSLHIMLRTGRVSPGLFAWALQHASTLDDLETLYLDMEPFTALGAIDTAVFDAAAARCKLPELALFFACRRLASPQAYMTHPAALENLGVVATLVPSQALAEDMFVAVAGVTRFLDKRRAAFRASHASTASQNRVQCLQYLVDHAAERLTVDHWRLALENSWDTDVVCWLLEQGEAAHGPDAFPAACLQQAVIGHVTCPLANASFHRVQGSELFASLRLLVSHRNFVMSDDVAAAFPTTLANTVVAVIALVQTLCTGPGHKITTCSPEAAAVLYARLQASLHDEDLATLQAVSGLHERNPALTFDIAFVLKNMRRPETLLACLTWAEQRFRVHPTVQPPHYLSDCLLQAAIGHTVETVQWVWDHMGTQLGDEECSVAARRVIHILANPRNDNVACVDPSALRFVEDCADVRVQEVREGPAPPALTQLSLVVAASLPDRTTALRALEAAAAAVPPPTQGEWREALQTARERGVAESYLWLLREGDRADPNTYDKGTLCSELLHCCKIRWRRLSLALVTHPAFGFVPDFMFRWMQSSKGFFADLLVAMARNLSGEHMDQVWSGAELSLTSYQLRTQIVEPQLTFMDVGTLALIVAALPPSVASTLTPLHVLTNMRGPAAGTIQCLEFLLANSHEPLQMSTVRNWWQSAVRRQPLEVVLWTWAQATAVGLAFQADDLVQALPTCRHRSVADHILRVLTEADPSPVRVPRLFDDDIGTGLYLFTHRNVSRAEEDDVRNAMVRVLDLSPSRQMFIHSTLQVAAAFPSHPALALPKDWYRYATYDTVAAILRHLGKTLAPPAFGEEVRRAFLGRPKTLNSDIAVDLLLLSHPGFVGDFDVLRAAIGVQNPCEAVITAAAATLSHELKREFVTSRFLRGRDRTPAAYEALRDIEPAIKRDFSSLTGQGGVFKSDIVRVLLQDPTPEADEAVRRLGRHLWLILAHESDTFRHLELMLDDPRSPLFDVIAALPVFVAHLAQETHPRNVRRMFHLVRRTLQVHDPDMALFRRVVQEIHDFLAIRDPSFDEGTWRSFEQCDGESRGEGEGGREGTAGARPLSPCMTVAKEIVCDFAQRTRWEPRKAWVQLVTFWSARR
jgi:hypothetical protein